MPRNKAGIGNDVSQLIADESRLQMTASESKPIARQWKPVISVADRKALFWSFFLYLAVLFPVFIADRYNVDDWGRAVLGYYNWGHDGRPLSDWLMQLVDNGRPFTDCSPLPQLLAILCLCLTALFAAKRFRIESPFLIAIAALTLGANPFYLTNLSFKFDALPMSLALLLAVVAALDWPIYHRRPIWAAIGGTIFLYASLCLYQPCFNAFLVFTVFEIVQAQQQQAELVKIGKFLSLRIMQAIAALLLYDFLVAGHLTGEYALEHAGLIRPDQAVVGIWDNLIASWSFIFLVGSSHLRWPLLIVPGLALLVSVCFGLRYIYVQWRASLKSGLLSVGLTLAVAFGFVFAVGGVLLLVQSPTGGARTYVGFSALLFASICYLVRCLQSLRVHWLFALVFSFVAVFPLASFASTYANAIKTQKVYEAHVANLIGDDLVQLQPTEDWKHLILLGDVGFAPGMKTTYFRKYPVLSSLVPIDLRSDASGGFGNTVLKFHGTKLDKYSRTEDGNTVSQQVNPNKLLKAAPYYEIYAIGGDLVVRLKSNF